MAHEIMVVVIGLLFAAVAGLLGYGAYAFGVRGGTVQPTRVSMGREVLWTGVAAVLLLVIFLYAHP